MMSVGYHNILEYFPVGVKFLPTEAELLGHFLYNKVAGALEQVDALSVKDLDIYGEEPWRIWDENGGRQAEAQGCKDLYFFTELKAKHSKGSGLMISRTVCGIGGRGTWDGEDAPTEVYKWDKSSKKRVLLGSKKRFKYVRKSGGCCGGDAEWIMIEYSLNPEFLPTRPSSSSTPNNLVLCSLRKKPLPKKKKRKVIRCLESNNHDDKERSTKRILLMDDHHHHHHHHHQQQELIHHQIQQHQSNLQPTISNYDHNIPAAGALIPSQIGGGLAANGSLITDSTLYPDFSLDDFLFQDFGSVDEAFPDLFKDN